MKITRVETYTPRHRLARATGPSIHLYAERDALLVKISTDEGLTGWGETALVGGFRALIEEVCTPILIGQDPCHHRRLWRMLWDATLGNGYVVGALDMALHDLWGKATGRSIGDLYGGRMRDRVPVYASALSYIEGVDPAEHWLPEAENLVDRGFSAIKMRIGRFPPAYEIPLIARLRDTLPDNVRLMADGNAAYTLPAAMRVGRALERIGLDWFEEPSPQLAPTQAEYAGYETLVAGLDIPIAGGEVLQTRGSFLALLRAGKVDIVQPDVAICGGIAECLFVADMARLMGIPCVPHCWGGALSIIATLHVLSLMPAPTGGPMAEVPMLEYDTTENPLRTRLLTTLIEPVDGFLAVPTGPGLGVTVDEAALARFLPG